MKASSSSNKNYVWGATLGYDYKLNQNWLAGLEGGYVDFGKTTYTNAGTNNVDASEASHGYQILATGTYIVNSGWNAVAKLGAINEKTNINPNNAISGTNIDATDVNKWEPAAAFGVGYMPIQNLNIVLQWEHVFGQSWDIYGQATKPMTQDAITLGLTYKFAM
jgi:opacity protein-like surface antigen